MPSLGELFIELGVAGDVKPLEKAIGTMKEAVKQIDNEIKANQRLLKYLQDIKNARTAGEKATIKENFTNEIKKQKMLDEIDANKKAVDGKKEFASKIAGVVKGVGALVGAFTGAAIAMNKFTNDLVQTNQAMLDLTRTSDIALGTFQKWGSIGKMLGVDNVEQQLEGLNQRMFDLMLTGEGARGFQLAGINPVGQDAEGVLEQLRNRVSGMNDTTATYLLQQMGLDPRMLHLLRMSRTEFEELGQTIEKYRLSDDQTKEIQAMNIQLQIAGIKLKYLKDRAILALMPAWLQFVESLARVTEGLSIAVKWVTDLIQKTPELKQALMGVAVALGVLLAMAHPVWAALAALYLIIDDIMGYYQGGRSGIGYLIGFFDDLAEDFETGNFGGMLEKLIGPVKALSTFSFPWVKQLLELNKVINNLQKGFEEGGIYNDAAKYGAKIGKNWRQKWGLDGTVTGEAAPFKMSDIDRILADEEEPVAVETEPDDYSWVPKMIEETAKSQGQKGYVGNLLNFDKMFIPPASVQNSSTTTTNNDSRQITQNISIQTEQPAADIQTQLTYARNAMASGWA